MEIKASPKIRIKYKIRKALRWIRINLGMVLLFISLSAIAVIAAVLLSLSGLSASGRSSEVLVGSKDDIGVEVRNGCWIPVVCPTIHSVRIRSANPGLEVIDSPNVDLAPGESKVLNVTVLLKVPYMVEDGLIAVSREEQQIVHHVIIPKKQAWIRDLMDVYLITLGEEMNVSFSVESNLSQNLSVRITSDVPMLINGINATEGVVIEADRENELHLVPRQRGDALISISLLSPDAILDEKHVIVKVR